MNKNGKKEELQSRREFFKKAAKGALPILSAIVLANAPIIANATEEAPMGCSNSCYRGCASHCSGRCQTTCNVSCQNHCRDNCGATCKYTCSGKCTNNNKY
ncbi:MAG: Cys-Xaa-Xaa-Xaa repeat radical SAM target protein [Phocaeicola sp.]